MNGPVNPRSYLRITLAVLVVSALVGAIALLYTSSVVDETTKRATTRAKAAVLLSQTEDQTRELIVAMNTRVEAYLGSAEFATLPPIDRYAVRVELNRQDAEPTGPELPDLLITVSNNQSLNFQRAMDALLTKAGPLFDALPDADREAGHEKLTQTATAIDRYYRQPSIREIRLLRSELVGLRNFMEDSVPLLLDASLNDQQAARAASHSARWGLMVTIIAVLCLVVALTWLLSRRIQAYMDRYAAEGDELRETTHRLQYRNSQLNALYNVFSEITDTLSLPYVISATTREALRVMNADIAVLRMLKNNELVAVGNLTAEGIEVDDLPPVKLGEGPTGRAAKRGKTVRIKEQAQQLLGPVSATAVFSPTAQIVNAGVQSGIVVPLIVGARVVGTLACWSRNPDAFNEEDEKVLEMMASQVATAVVVADHTAASEHRAHHDALTGLPNRLQLSEDLSGDLAGLAMAGRSAVVAMADIDHFKEINDEFGHNVGDVSLQKVAHVLRSTVRASDRVYRYGGEEFVIVFVDCDAETGRAQAERVRIAIEGTPLTGDGMEPVGPVTISMGLAALPDHGTDIESLIWFADEAMYRAKDAGRNRVFVFGAEDRALIRVA